jgi:Mg-chelatase subunit ChlD
MGLKLFFLLCLSIFIFSCAGGVQEKEEPVEAGKLEEIDNSAAEDKSGVKELPAKSAEAESTGETYASEAEAPFAVKKEVVRSLTDSMEGGATSRSSYTPSTSGLKAGYADDNRQFNYFIKFLKTYSGQVEHLPLNIAERIILKAVDRDGLSLANCQITISAAGRVLCRGKTHADGSFKFYPSEYEDTIDEFTASFIYNQHTQEIVVDRQGKRELEVNFPFARSEQKSIPLDIVFILDTTGSMGEEINRLKATIEIIKLNLTSLSSRPKVRFGMVLYKDIGDEYRTHVIPLTGSLPGFQKDLDLVEASGGGDTPEDLQAALEAAMTHPDWSRNGIRLSFIITDAPPHLDYEQEYTYIEASKAARREGIKIYSVGTGGLNLMGEYILRQISQYTGAKYIFLTYGEEGESEGGMPGSVSHHTGANYQTDKLEAIIIRFAKEELAHLTDQPVDQEEDYFQAQKIDDEEREETLKKLFEMALSQLVDYSSFNLSPGIRAAVLPITAMNEDMAPTAEYFTEQLILSLDSSESMREIFRQVERKDLQSILTEMELQLSGLVEESQAAQVGLILGAEVLIIGKLYLKEGCYELFLKLLRVKNGEILSVTKAILDRKLGL